MFIKKIKLLLEFGPRFLLIYNQSDRLQNPNSKLNK